MGVQAEGVAQTVLLPPSQPCPAREEGVKGPEKREKNRELHGPACLLLPLVVVWIIGYYSGYRLLIDGYTSLSLTCA